MQDLIKAGEAWFETQRREYLAELVDYRPLVGVARTCRATLVTGRWDAIDKSGQVIRVETRDFLIHRDDLEQDPKRGDRVAVTKNGVEKLYEVSIPDGSKNPWRWSDRSETIRRIHTMALQTSTAPVGGPMLIRAMGVSTASAITDQQIREQLALDMSTSRTMLRQLLAASSYVYIVLPDSFGSPTISVNGIPTSAWELTTRPILFVGQSERTYRIYRSTYAITGSPLVEVT